MYWYIYQHFIRREEKINHLALISFDATKVRLKSAFYLHGKIIYGDVGETDLKSLLISMI